MIQASFDNWSRLPGKHVKICRHGHGMGTGRIEMAANQSIAWIRSDPLAERPLMDKADGVELRMSVLQAHYRI